MNFSTTPKYLEPKMRVKNFRKDNMNDA